MRDPVLADLSRELCRMDLEGALEEYAESYGSCEECGGDFKAEDLGDWTIRLKCRKCGEIIEKYNGPDYD